LNPLSATTPDELLTATQGTIEEISGKQYFEEMAQIACRRLYEQYPQSIALARMYVTVPMAALPGKNAAWVRNLALAKGIASELTDSTRIISLVGTAGRLPAWNDRHASEGHIGIPMTSASFIDAIPMMSRLMGSLGGGLSWIDGEDAAMVISRLGTVAGTFYVADAATEIDAKGRKIIPAADFVAEQGIKTVFGLGGAFASGQLLVELVFCSEPVPLEVVSAFQAPFLRFKSASARVLKHVFCDGTEVRPAETAGAVSDAAHGGSQVGEPSSEEPQHLARLLAEKQRELATLNGLYLELESQLEDRTRSLKLILDSTGDGLLLIDLDGSPYGERTASLDRWLGAPAPCQKAWDYLFGKDSAEAISFEMNLSQIADDTLPFDVVASQMPRQFTRADRTYEVGYRQVSKPGQPQRILLLVRDISSRIAAEQAATRARELHAVVGNILRDQRGFHNFVDETSGLIEQIGASRELAQQLRDLHTLKGNTAIFGFESLSKLVHELEGTQIAEAQPLADQQLQALRHAWSDALSMVADFVRRGDGIEISVHEHDDFLRQLLSGVDAEKLAAVARSWRHEPVAPVLRRLGAQAERIAEKLGKRVKVSIKDVGLRVPVDATRNCWSSLVHLVRNAVDHGIEPTEQRIACGKPPEGQIALTAGVDADRLIVTIADDGRGVDWEAVRAQARSGGLPSESYDDLLAAVFEDGCSTCSEATEISGRGVGLSAVRAAYRAVSGDVELESAAGVGTAVRAWIPCGVACQNPPFAADWRAESPHGSGQTSTL
jgi:signal transduction histidine kinase